jgi:phosphoribosylanthranilate isomerase
LQAKSIGPWCLDINSMIETEPGVKSIDKAKEIFKLIADV